MTIEINNESDLDIDLKSVREVAEYVIEQLKLHPTVDLGIIFVNEKPMTDLHIQWMDEPGPTDVLSFPMDELRPGAEDGPMPEGVLGDVVICPQVAKLQADAAGHGVMDEVHLLLTHGILHLLGFDHAEPDEEREMFKLQKALLEGFNSGRSA
ncbi:MAG: rRNA maturation RNase YbeY [Actinomycetota bacterium]|jgi:probable rRNA maturation factor